MNILGAPSHLGSMRAKSLEGGEDAAGMHGQVITGQIERLRNWERCLSIFHRKAGENPLSSLPPLLDFQRVEAPPTVLVTDP